MASSQTVFRVAIIPQEVEDLRSLLGRLSPLVRQPVGLLEREFKRERSLAFIPTTIVRYVPKDIALRLEEARFWLPGMLVKPETMRHYPLGEHAAHVLGYLSQPTAEELPLLKQYGVRAKELVGRSGLERLLDQDLRGHSGGVMVEVNNRARQVRVLGDRPSTAGARVTLTIDAPLQSLIEEAFGAQPGAAVVLDPQTGEVLAMVSRPGFTPEVFAIGAPDAVQRFLDDPRAPLMNRATIGVYQPGSITKLIVAAAALEHHVITPETTITCQGSVTIGDRTFHCWNRDGHGPVSLTEAIMHSCNMYFMQVGRWLGAGRLRAALGTAGLGRRTGWPLEEQTGHLPQRRLTEGEVALLAIGQGEILVTVLQEAVVAGAFANGGWLVEPWVIREVGERKAVPHGSRRSAGWSQQTIEAVVEGMRAVVRQPAGTGHRAYTPAVSIAGKTGTAQTHVPDRPHGWFMGFCPVEQPRVAMAIVTEHGGSGGDLPTEIARAICEYVSAPETL